MQNSILIYRGIHHNISKFAYVLYWLLRFLWFFSCFYTLVQWIISLVINKAVCGLISLPTLYYYFMFYWKHTFLSFCWLLSMPIKQNQIDINPAWKYYVRPYIVPKCSTTPSDTPFWYIISFPDGRHWGNVTSDSTWEITWGSGL